MTNAVTLVIKGGQGQPAQFVAQAALGDTAPGHGGQRHQTLVVVAGRVVLVHRLPVLVVHGGLLLDLVHKGGYQSVHLNSLS